MFPLYLYKFIEKYFGDLTRSQNKMFIITFMLLYFKQNYHFRRFLQLISHLQCNISLYHSSYPKKNSKINYVSYTHFIFKDQQIIFLLKYLVPVTPIKRFISPCINTLSLSHSIDKIAFILISICK